MSSINVQFIATKCIKLKLSLAICVYFVIILTVKRGEDMDKLYTVKETADILKLSVRQVYNLIKSGHIQIIKINKSTRVREKEIKRITEGL